MRFSTGITSKQPVRGLREADRQCEIYTGITSKQPVRGLREADRQGEI